MSTLFIVPCDAAPTRSGAACASAPRHTSATRWLTSTLPAPTATGGRAATIDARRRDTRTDAARRRSPGSSGSTTVRNANATALTVTASTALTLPGRCASVPVKSNVTVVARDGHRDARSVPGAAVRRRAGRVEHVVEPYVAVGRARERGAHPALAVVDDLAERRRRRELAQARDAETVRAHAARRGRRAARRACATRRRTSASTSARQQHRRDAQALLVDLGRVGRHRPGRHAAEVGVVRAVRDPADAARRRRRTRARRA